MASPTAGDGDLGRDLRAHLAQIEHKIDLLSMAMRWSPGSGAPGMWAGGRATHRGDFEGAEDVPLVSPLPNAVPESPSGEKAEVRFPQEPRSPKEQRGCGTSLRAAAWMPSLPQHGEETPGGPARETEPTAKGEPDLPPPSASRRSGGDLEQVKLSGITREGSSLLDRAIDRVGLSQLWEDIEQSLARTRKERGYRLVKSSKFQLAVCSVILLQGMMIGYGAANAFEVHAYGGEPARWADYVEIAFAVFFVIELSLRMGLERLLFIFGAEWKWNLFDSILVLMSLSDLISHGTDSGSLGGAAVGRILRLSRFFALMRLSRVMRQLPSLRIILMSILDSMISLVWCFLFIAFIMYVFAVFIVYGAADHLRTSSDEELEADLITWWGGIYRSMVTLFMTISGGCDWRDPLLSLRAMSAAYEPLFLFYIFFMCFGVLNVVVGAFVATTQQIAANDPEAAAKYAVGQVESYLHRIRGFFKQADVDQTGTLSWEEFRNHLQDRKVQAYFQALDLDVSQAHVLFSLLDADDSGAVTVEEFVDGCVRLRGQAKSIDVNRVMYMCERAFARMSDFMESFAGQPGFPPVGTHGLIGGMQTTASYEEEA